MHKELKHKGFIDPFVFKNLPMKAVVENGKITLGSMLFEFKDETYPDGTTVELNCGRYSFCCLSLKEKADHEKEQKLAREAQRAAEQVKRNQKEEANRIFNRKLNVPVRWIPVIKMNWSGLLEHSRCNGSKRNSVYHIFLLADFQNGKLVRRAESYLCSPGKESVAFYRDFTDDERI
jgi:hypothetical protein